MSTLKIFSPFTGVLFLILWTASTHATDVLDGEWEFDAEKTREGIQQKAGFDDEAMHHLMKAYLPVVWICEKGHYTMKVKGETISGSYSLKALGGNRYSVVMTCSKEPHGDKGVVEITDTGFIYFGEQALIEGTGDIYRRVAEKP